MARGASLPPPYRVDGFFGLRTPLLPFTEYLRWVGSCESAAVWEDAEALERARARDMARLRRDLRRIVDRPEVREALYLASSTLYSSLAHWEQQPESERAKDTEVVLVRYFHRMTHRCTPFGLFAGHSVGKVGDDTQLQLEPMGANRRRTRLDRGGIARLVAHMDKSAALRELMQYRPNNSLYEAAGRLRYTEFSIDDNGYRSYRLVAVTPSAPLLATLDRARAGARVQVLAEALAHEESVTLEEAREFVHELIDSQILVSELEPKLTGEDSADELAERLESCAETRPVARSLREAAALLEALDRRGLGHAPEGCPELAAALAKLPLSVAPARWLQVDLFKPAPNAILGREVIAELEQTTALLRRLTPRPKWDALAAFKEAFKWRYEGRWVPLMEALDPESGIGFPVGAADGYDDAPLLHGCAFKSTTKGANEPGGWSRREVQLYRRLQELATEGRHEWQLTDEDLRLLDEGSAAEPAPDSGAMVATLAAPSADAFARGEFQLYVRGFYGPSGARTFGRFCYGDSLLHEHTRAHLRKEESFRPDAIFAEIVHLSQGRTGNLLARPVLREHEIVFLGRSGAPMPQQIAVTDLLVSVVDGRVVLYSRRLGKEVIPRLTSAAIHSRGLGLYAFLGALQEQGLVSWFGWDWGALGRERCLPRVTYGRTVLARAQWWIEGEELKPVLQAGGTERYRAAQVWRRARGLPRMVLLADDDNELLVDLDNPLSIEMFCDLVRLRSSFALVENYPGPELLAAHGAEGSFAHELVVPMLRTLQSGAAPESLYVHPDALHDPATDSLTPGSEWLYWKLYGGPGSADLVLIDTVAPAIAEFRGRGAVDGWFFIRYEDPDPHLRVRVHGNPARLCGEVLPELHRRLEALVGDGTLWRIELGTYQRETDRYGGPANIARAERLFEFDSDATVDIVRLCAGDAGAAARWQLTLAGADRWLCDFGFDLAARHEQALRVREALLPEFATRDNATEKWLSSRFRAERAALEALLDPQGSPASELHAEGLAILARRAAAVAPLLAESRALHGDGLLTTSLHDLSQSVIHMFVNRALRSSQRAQELVIYDFLCRLYGSALARRASPRATKQDTP